MHYFSGKGCSESLESMHYCIGILKNALLEIEKQKKLFEQMKQEAEISQQITTMNQEQVNALNTLLENTLNKQEKKTFPKTLLWNLFFCLLSAILGYILGKLL